MTACADEKVECGKCHGKTFKVSYGRTVQVGERVTIVAMACTECKSVTTLVVVGNVDG